MSRDEHVSFIVDLLSRIGLCISLTCFGLSCLYSMINMQVKEYDSFSWLFGEQDKVVPVFRIVYDKSLCLKTKNLKKKKNRYVNVMFVSFLLS